MLPLAFYQRDAETVARELLGQTLVRVQRNAVRRARIVETEAYVGAHDLACHAARGRTARTEVMFREGGYAYVYFIYGMYHMLNVVTGQAGDAQAVLLRAAEPLDGWQADLSGPGKLAGALTLTRAHSGTPFTSSELHVLAAPRPAHIATSPRIGVAYAGAWRDVHLRFFDPASAAVSRGGQRLKRPPRRPAPSAPPQRRPG